MVAKKKTAKKGISKARLKNKAPRDLDLKGRVGSVRGGNRGVAAGSTSAKGGITYAAYDSFSGLGTGGTTGGAKGGPGPAGPGGTE